MLPSIETLLTRLVSFSIDAVVDRHFEASLLAMMLLVNLVELTSVGRRLALIAGPLIHCRAEPLKTDPMYRIGTVRVLNVKAGLNTMNRYNEHITTDMS